MSQVTMMVVGDAAVTITLEGGLTGAGWLGEKKGAGWLGGKRELDG